MIRGRTITLRPIELRDRDNLRKWQDDPDIMTGWAMPRPLLAHDAFEADLAGRFGQFLSSGHFIIEGETGPIGRIDFDGFDERHRAAELSLYIGDHAAHGEGLARDSVATLARYLFEERRAARVWLTVISSNVRARNSYAAVGFQEEGVLRDHVHFGGAYHNEVVMAVYSISMLPS